MTNISLQRLGIVMQPDPEDPYEAWGVLNPATARSREGHLYLFPRLVATGNVSRIGIARVRFDAAKNPAGVSRLGYALEPKEAYEQDWHGYSGVEDPRITYLTLLDRYVMVYTALSADGPKVAMAVSHDLVTWDRLGLVRTGRHDEVNFDRYTDKDGVLFPAPVLDPLGQPAFALLHRPTYLVRAPGGQEVVLLPRGVRDGRESIWISYIPVVPVITDIAALTRVRDTALVTTPREPWESLKIGAGPPPILTEHGWLLFYHGVSGSEAGHDIQYEVGFMLLDRADPRRVLERSREPILQPTEPEERAGMVSNVVFPTGVDVRGRRVDLYYGAADQRIATATATLDVPALLAPSAPPAQVRAA